MSLIVRLGYLSSTAVCVVLWDLRDQIIIFCDKFHEKYEPSTEYHEKYWAIVASTAVLNAFCWVREELGKIPGKIV